MPPNQKNRFWCDQKPQPQHSTLPSSRAFMQHLLRPRGLPLYCGNRTKTAPRRGATIQSSPHLWDTPAGRQRNFQRPKFARSPHCTVCLVTPWPELTLPHMPLWLFSVHLCTPESLQAPSSGPPSKLHNPHHSTLPWNPAVVPPRQDRGSLLTVDAGGPMDGMICPLQDPGLPASSPVLTHTPHCSPVLLPPGTPLPLSIQ